MDTRVHEGMAAPAHAPLGQREHDIRPANQAARDKGPGPARDQIAQIPPERLQDEDIGEQIVRMSENRWRALRESNPSFQIENLTS